MNAQLVYTPDECLLQKLHACRGPLKEALESKRPLTRSVLEAKISEVQSMLDDAVSRKAYQECAPLQEKLDNLIKKRLDLPTFEELEEAVRKAENDVAKAAARRDFKGAASYQVIFDRMLMLFCLCCYCDIYNAFIAIRAGSIGQRDKTS